MGGTPGIRKRKGSSPPVVSEVKAKEASECESGGEVARTGLAPSLRSLSTFTHIHFRLSVPSQSVIPRV